MRTSLRTDRAPPARTARTRRAPVAAQAAKLHVHVPGCALPFGSHLRLVGGDPALGGWDPDAAPSLAWAEGDDWHASVDIDADDDGADAIPCKLVIVHGDGSVEWEAGADRALAVPPAGGGASVALAFGSTSVASYEADPAGVAAAASAAEEAVAAAEAAAEEEARVAAAAAAAAEAEAAAKAEAAAAKAKPKAKAAPPPPPPPPPPSREGKAIKVAGQKAYVAPDGSVTLSFDGDSDGEDAATLAARLLKGRK